LPYARAVDSGQGPVVGGVSVVFVFVVVVGSGAAVRSGSPGITSSYRPTMDFLLYITSATSAPVNLLLKPHTTTAGNEESD